MYLLSSFVASSSIFTIILSFSFYELFPEERPIFLKFSKTVLKVRPALGSLDFLVKKEPKVFWVLLPNWATRPKSPSFLNYSRI